MSSRRFLATLACLTLAGAAHAADLPVRVVKASAPVVAGYGPFYILGAVGAGASSSQNDLTIPGRLVQGSDPKQWPTGFLIELGFGVEALTPIGKVQGELRTNYDFTAASFGCVATFGCMGHTRNGWLFQEMAYWSPIAAPLSFTKWQWAQSLGLYAGVGAAERQLNVCVNTNLFAGPSVCDTAWLTGLDVGAKVEIPLTEYVKARITADWVNYDHRIVPAASPVFTSAFKAENEWLFAAGLDWHF